ncbi:MAG: ABC transporter permease [Anaerolineales bacterium]|nr:ABC transporter permease [Anaerolineales bacterium]
MWAYILRRLVQAIITLFIITIVCFILTRLSSDPMAQYANRPGLTPEDKARIRHQLGLDRTIPVEWIHWMGLSPETEKKIVDNSSLPIQYFSWLGLALKGELGTSFFSKQPVSQLIAERLPLTLLLMATAQTITVFIALGLGIVSATKQYSLTDNIITSLSFIGYSMPIFFIALGLMLIFAVRFKAWGLPYLPTGADVWNRRDVTELIRHMVLPVSCLVIIQTAGYARYIRSSILEVLSLDYIRTARAKGLTERSVLYKHALRNAALPFITILGLDIPYLLGGALVTESVYAWPGMGRLFWEYAQRGDYPVVLGVLLIVSAAVVVFSILTDIMYIFIDPRIRLG